MRSSPQVAFSAAISRIGRRRSLGRRGRPIGLDFQRQNSRNPWRCQRMRVDALTFTSASRHGNMRLRVAIIQRAESLARRGLTWRFWKSASCLRRKRFSAASARREWTARTARRIRSITTGTIVRKQCATVRKSDEPGINAQHGTLQNVTGPTTAAWQEFLRTTPSPSARISIRQERSPDKTLQYTLDNMVRVALLLSITLGRALAQTSTGAIDGIVVDSSGAAVPGAHIRLLGTETGEVVRELTSVSDGTFAAPLLRPMAYTVEVTAQGFKKLMRPGIVLRVDDALNLRLALEIGAMTDAVTVSATVDLLEETTNTVGQTVDERTMQQLPLNGRNYLQLGN